MDELLNNVDPEIIINKVIPKSFPFLIKQSFDANSHTQKRQFSRETKSQAFIEKALQGAIKCEICKGYLHRNSVSIDHIERIEDGGKGSIENAQLTHPYCNTAIKN